MFMQVVAPAVLFSMIAEKLGRKEMPSHRCTTNQTSTTSVDLVYALERIHLTASQLDRCGSAERESEGFHAWIEKLDFESPVSAGTGLPDQLVEPLLANDPVVLLVDTSRP